MAEAAQHEQYELAGKYRDRLQSLLRIQELAQTRKFIDRTRSDAYQYHPEEDIRIEAYDISNNQGTSAVGSQVVGVIRRGKVEPVKTREELRKRFYLEKSGYRKYRIKTVEGISDTDMLQEVLLRRFKRASTGERWALPDLILIDGGKGQLHTAEKMRDKLDVLVPLASVAKGPTRKRVDLYGKDFAKFPLLDNQAWSLAAELLREEAHRFAITYYRSVHRKSVLN